jgi:CRP/FNR family transcriptional regulator
MDNALFKLVNFPQGSYIILEGERKSTQFYIIKDGKVNLKKDFPVAGEKANEVLGPGDFFGVIAAMSQYPQIESAVAMTNVTLISVSHTKFGELIQKNSPLALKIIRYFSKKLRQFDEPAGRSGVVSNANALTNLEIFFQLAEFYFNQGNIETAVYLYQSYLKYVEQGELVEKAKKQLKMLGRGFELEPKTGTNRIYQPEEMIFCENEPGNDLFIVQRGRVRISKFIQGKDVILNIMKPGDIFGEMALLDNKPRSASASAVEETELIAINKQNFENMVVSQPQLMTRIIVLLSERIWNAYKKIANAQLPDINSRIADMLMTIVERNKVKIAPKVGYTFDLGPMELLKMLGLSDREMGSLAKFMGTYKFIKIEGDYLACTDLALLDRMVYQHRQNLKEAKASAKR